MKAETLDVQASFWKRLCPFFLLSFKFNFQIPIVERQGAQPQMSESRVLDLFELRD